MRATSSDDRPKRERGTPRRRHRQVKRIHAAFARLTEPERLAITAASRDGLTYRQIAAQAGISESEVLRYMRQDLAELRRLIVDNHH